MTFQTIRYNIQDHIATVTLARPEKLNAFNTTMRHELLSVFDDIDADDHVRAVIVTGDGRAFCAGADIRRAPRRLISNRVIRSMGTPTFPAMEGAS